MSVASPATPVERVAAALERIAASDRPEVWTHVADPEAALAAAAAVDPAAPLAGVTVGVKDNIDVAGMPTTAGCPAYGYAPDTDAACVAALTAAGAVIVGKTNMDQFATGLVGVRSPFGAVRDALRPEYVSGGSSSGSAVAVALGLCDLGLGTDTAGSGRVPAAFQGIVGVKPSVGAISTDGVVPACASFDCISVFATSIAAASAAVGAMTDPNLGDSLRTVRSESPTFAVWPGEALSQLSAGYRVAYDDAVAGLMTVEIDPAPFVQAGRLLYGGALVRERYAAVGAFIEQAETADVDPVVRQLILDAKRITRAQYDADLRRLETLRREAVAQLNDVDALLLPTAPFQPTIADVRADPLALNRRLGAYTTFCNLLGMCAVSVPAGVAADGGQFGVTLYGRGGCDARIAGIAASLSADQPAASASRFS